jgi:uncharacterized membrane protein YczE
MKKIDRGFILLWAKRLLIYLVGLYCMAIGVVFSAKSSLGVSPVGSLANVLYQIGLAENMPSYVNLGNCTTAVYCLYILTEFLILRKEFKLKMLLQLVASFLFGQLVNLATAMMSFLPTPPNYVVQMIYLLCSVPMVAVGVMLYLTPNILPTPGEGMSLAISSKTGWSVGSSKTLFDCSLVIISAITSLVYFHALVGVREGTVICALLVGYTMKQMQKVWQKPLLHFVEREDRVSRALTEAAGGFQLDASGKPKIIITIGREFGSGGYEVGKLLAEKLGITFYDSQLNTMAAAQSGLPISKVEELEHHLEREVVYDFKNAAYAMTTGSLSPEEKLFVAQTTVIRQIAAGDESCVIIGRCADYVLYDDPNCFRLYIHARPDARTERVMRQFDLTEAQAKIQMENTDKARAQHYKRFTGRDYGKQEYYHLGVDSGMLGTEGSVDVIIDTIKRWCDVRGTHPLSALHDQ